MQQGHDDFAFEHAPGLPGPLPEGEKILWQGRPDAWRLAVESLLVKWVVGYCVLLALWRFGSALADHSVQVAIGASLPIIGVGLVAGLLFWGFSWVQAKATVYTITTSRVLLRIGAALQVTMNLPFSQLNNAALDLRKGGTGTIALEPKRDGGKMLSYLALWPHCRPWHMRLPEPALRCVPDAVNVSEILADAAEAHLNLPRVVRAPLASEPDCGTPMPNALPAAE